MGFPAGCTLEGLFSEQSVPMYQRGVNGDFARIEGVRKDKYFEISIPPDTQLIKENSQWKWYVNQKPK